MKTKLLLLLAVFAFEGSFATANCKVVVTDPTVITLPVLTYCDPNNDGFGVFDFADLNYIILAGQSGSSSNYMISYHETLSDANVGANSISSSYININPFNQTVYYRIVKIATSEYAVGSLDLVVNLSPEATTPTDISLCDYNNDGFEVFDFTALIAQILGVINPSTATVTFYTTQVSANVGVNPIGPINSYVGTNGQTIWVRVANNATECYDVVSFNLIVNPIPVSTQPNYPTYSLCDSDQTSTGFETFDLGSQINAILLGQIGMNVSFYSSLGDAQNGTGEITNLMYVNEVQYIQTLGIRITNNATGCYAISTMDIRVEPLPTPIPPPAPYTICDENQDGISCGFDLTTLVPDILQGANYMISFYETLPDANLGVYPINTSQPYCNILPFMQTLYVKAVDNITECYTVLPIELVVNTTPIVALVSNNTLNTVYVDGLNNVVQPLTLDAQLSGNYAFAWQVDGAPIPNAISSVYTVNTASSTGVSRTFLVSATNLTTGCIASSSIVVEQSSGTPSPLGPISQTYNPGDTLYYLNVAGSNILWYASASGKMTTVVNSTPLPLNTVLVNGTTYYATQTINGIESVARLPVTVSLALGIDHTAVFPIQYAPNPVKNSLTLQSTVVLKSVRVYTMLGQKVFEHNYNDMNVTIDLSRLATGNYILKVQGDNGQKTLRIIKE